ncbi:glucokinase [Xylona heveae TC161]|uniref:Phosphotransferase n=1 Tax=Xylona heveae (strain CBS 132557 / TC161) TaxID=1328760 RepID=A0A165FGD9_XYLHT|nr:glucokinase [Xylona heveae TC161]KZF20945.1 glucokinase [Xylona heveae TC161]
MSWKEEVQKVADEFIYTNEDVNKGVKEFLREMDEGLSHSGSTLSQIPTYVTSVPNGTEKGLYLAVDLGGTNFRVCSIQLRGNTTFSLTQSKVAIPRELMVAKTSKELFSFLAKQIEVFLKTHHNDHFQAVVRRRRTMSISEGFREEEIFQLGFTFSFPVQQHGINRGTLIRWTKGFDIADAVGKDVCVLLQDEIDELHLPVRVAALVNDTVGTLMARSYTSPGKTGTLLGAIFGTGTNGAYVEKLKNITKLPAASGANYDDSTGEMIVNTEWGSFDNGLRVLPNTSYDEALDKESVNPGIQMFEKRVSGMFLGEILRRAMLALVKDPKVMLFKDEDSSSNDIHSTTNIAPDSPLFTQWGLDTSFLSIVAGDTSYGLKVIKQTLDKELGISAASTEDAEAVKVLAAAIGKRAARLSAVPIAGIVHKSGRLGKTSASASHAASKVKEHVQNLEVGEAAKTAAEGVQASAAPVVDLPPTGGVGNDEDDVVDIGVDGSLVEYYPGFEDYLREALREIPEIGAKGEKKIRIGIAKDGSGVGAALIALVAGPLTASPPVSPIREKK